MKFKTVALIAALNLSAFSTMAQTESAISFKGFKGQVIDVVQGQLTVKENRANPDSRDLTLKYIKLPTTSKNPGNPIVYLSGGPGGSASGTAKGPRFDLFNKMRTQADVILFDQRGTGLSDQLDDCNVSPVELMGQATTEQSLTQHLAKHIPQCVSGWQEKGYDLNGYNTKESAQDLVALADTLGTDKIDLWAISYGTHLALATAKYHGDRIGKMVLASSEGLNQTIKHPKDTQLLLQAIAADVKEQYPDLLTTIENVLTQLEKEPVKVVAKHPRNGSDVPMMLGKLDVQLVTSYFLLKNTEDQSRLPSLFKAMEAGDYSHIARYAMYVKMGMARFNPMALAMDSASGVNKADLMSIKKQASSALLGNSSNLPFPNVSQYLPVNDLGDDFRATFSSNIPTLFLMGDRDGRTFIDRQKEVASQFSNAVTVELKGVGHDLFMSTPKVIEVMESFYAGVKVEPLHVFVAPPKYL